MINLKNLTISETHNHLTKGDFSAVELAQAYLSAIKETDGDIKAYLEIFPDVVEQAEEADKKIARKEEGLLTGIPLAIKDNILIKGRKCSAASKMLADYVAPYDSTVAKRLKDAGAVFLGRTNMDEFAMGGSTENSAFGPTRNPRDLSRVPGGSSGGSAAAVASDETLASLGSDTGGSVRQPASFCGVVGLKPSYGSVSRNGLIAMGSSLDQIGPITKTVADAEIIFNAIKGKDPMDGTSVETAGAISANRKNFKIGIPSDLMDTEGIDETALKNFNESAERFKSMGYGVECVNMPNVKYSLAVYYIIMPAEVSSNLARFDGLRYGLHISGKNLAEDYFLTRGGGFGIEARRRIMLGTYVLSSGYYDAYYNKANQVRSLIKNDYDEAFKKVDFVMTPTAPSPAWKIGEKIKNPMEMYLADIFTTPANITGIPAISLPSGFKKDGDKNLPLGIQLMSDHEREDLLFKAGKDFLNE
ncbi:MAG: Asp-tRNA(Asn)/Glu-tRNA(Gln) amidotransferase subunit GatA [Patescibacteria group bacterium]|nr:Asp-tRNA(Asn)/Glu-tRNA(Gln) amidotransferase subunit GatA [Patescibacteria group bacterium]MDE2218256.1 Asp-tRNA(Asn)/Glu-tRNA(Gln) amidotransferase subunit GatA [Patescibacteria group bacterium]